MAHTPSQGSATPRSLYSISAQHAHKKGDYGIFCS